MIPPRTPSAAIAALAVVVAVGSASAVTIPGKGPKRQDCLVQLSAEGVPFGKGPKGVTCADGDACDADGTRNGACAFDSALCLNMPTRSCTAGEVREITLRAAKKSGADFDPLRAAIAALPLPTSAPVCTASTRIVVAIGAPTRSGTIRPTKVKFRVRSTAGSRRDKDVFRLTCLPTTASGVTTTTTASATTTVTSSTLPTVQPGSPGAGLAAQITQAAVSPAGAVTVTFTLTDEFGVPVTPVGGATSNPNEARLRFTIARLDVDTTTQEGFTTDVTRYRSYVIGGNGQPGYDGNGSFATIDAARGVYTYTFATLLPPGFPASRTHTVGAQVERSFGGDSLVANPLFDFVPAGGPVATVRQVTATSECNGCHERLAAHGGARREVGLCQLCHTDQAVDPDTGNSIELQQMIHRIHQGKDLPSITGGPVGAIYEIVGFQGSRHVYAEKVVACAGGALNGVPCARDADCPNGTCTGATVEGVGFPQDSRNCHVCHTAGATAATHLSRPSTTACTGCHDDVNPSTEPTQAGPAGTNHLAGPQPEVFCRLCHTPSGEEFGLSVGGAHTVPLRSTALAGLVADILTAAGTAGNPATITFRVTDGAGMPFTSFAGFNTVRFVLNGPTTDFARAPISATAVGGGSSGMLAGPDPNGVWSYTTSAGNALPGGAAGSWRVGIEVRRSVMVDGANVNEAAQNDVLDFSVDGTPVEARRQVVDQAKCGACHGTFSVDFGVHGNLRNQIDHCVLCHNPTQSDFARRVNVAGADPMNEPIDLKHMLHKIHTGEELAGRPYVIYGFNGAVNDFGEVRFPGNRAACEHCHRPDTAFLPLPANVLPTDLTAIVGMTETPVAQVPPIQDACLSCHDGAATAAHAQTNTTPAGAEACGACHGEGAQFAVSAVHAAAEP